MAQLAPEAEEMNARRTLELVLALTFVLGLSASAAAQATTTTTSTTVPLGGFIGSTCQGELIAVDGQSHTTLHSTVNPQGDSNLVFHINVHGGGVGQTTGTSYTFNQTTSQIFNRHGNGALEFTTVEFIRIFAQGPEGRDFLIRLETHVIFNAQGELTVQINDFERVCD